MHYVGKTRKDPKQRFQEHIEGKGAECTRRFKPRRIEELIPVKHGEDGSVLEDMHVKRLMKQYSIDDVRGGSYSSVKLTEAQEENLENELLHQDNRCLVCGEKGHYSKSCPVKQGGLQQEPMRPVTCYSCGQRGHYSNNCPMIQEDVCFRCGRIGHFQIGCFAKTTIDGMPLSFNQCSAKTRNPGVPMPPQQCFRCGRTSHYARECFARNDVNGVPL